MTRRSLVFLGSLPLLVASCMDHVPYRKAGLNENSSCVQQYAAYDAMAEAAHPIQKLSTDHPCWQRSIEEHPTYDLLFAEFTDQGWIQESSGLDRPSSDYLDALVEKLDTIHRTWRTDQSTARYQGLSLVVFLHGWHHNARADDTHVVSFRRFLAEMASLEAFIAPKGMKPRRVVGLYIAWRGESVRIPWLNELTFWERKKTAERVSLGTVRELLNRLDLFRDRSRDEKNRRDVRMLTIGHSFGGLMTYASMGAEFVRNAVRFKDTKPCCPVDNYVSRIGDFVVIVNPAFEGARYEPLHTAGQRLRGLEPNQLPVLVVATSSADAATRHLFPWARRLNAAFEKKVGHEKDAIVKTVGHNDRYITHELSLCEEGDEKCAVARSCGIGADSTGEASMARSIAQEWEHMQGYAKHGFANQAYFCGGLALRATDQWYPKNNPFWVVRTSSEVIRDHGDVFNPQFVAFFRQLYLAFIHVRTEAKEPSCSRRDQGEAPQEGADPARLLDRPCPGR